MTEGSAPIRYLDAATVEQALPAPAEMVDLAEIALRSLLSGADVAAKAALDPGPGGVFAHAMPARLSAAAVPGGGLSADLLGMKWIAGGAANRAIGLPAMSALIVLNDPTTGVPLALMDGAVITAARTAALSGVAVRLLGPGAGDLGSRVTRAVLIGAGAQGRAHAAMLGAVLGNVALDVYDRHPERAAAMAASAMKMTGVAAARAASDLPAALARADVVISATSLESSGPVLGPRDVAADALVVPVDYGGYVTAALVAAATAFAVDSRERFEANRQSGRLPGWPDPTATLGALLLGRPERPPGIAVALHQGPGVADVIVADAVLRRATAHGLGLEIGR